MKTILSISLPILLAGTFAFAQSKPASFKVTTNVGSESNPLSNIESAEESSLSYSIKPELGLEYNLGNGFWLFGAAALSFKDFREDIVSNGAKSFSQIYEAGLSKTFGKHHEAGLSLGYTINNSRQLSFNDLILNPSLPPLDADGRPLKSKALNGVLSYAYLDTWGSVIFNISDLINKSSTLTNDEFGAEYEDTHAQQDFSIKFSFNLSEEIELNVTPYYSRRNYEDRPARNTEGITQATNPALEELHRGIEANISYDKKGQYKVTGSTIFIREKDLIFGAEDADVLGFSVTGEVPVHSEGDMKLSLKANFSFSTKEYSNFITDPTNVAIQDLREEDTTGFGLGIALQVNKKVDLDLSYTSTDVDSNYSVPGSSFKQDILSLSTVYKF